MFIGLNNAITGLTQDQLSKTINSLFSKNEQGVWYDPSDFSTMLQNAAGTTPVTAVEQPVGLILDKSNGLVLGPELVTNGDFSQGTTGWTPLAGSQAAENGELVLTNPAGGAAITYQAVSTQAGKTYRVVATMRRGTVVSCRLRVGINAGDSSLGAVESVATQNETLILHFSASTSASYIRLILPAMTGDETGYFDNISVRELPGNHAKQATTTSRPTLQQDSSGKYYLSFDGVDDYLSTGAIDFTGTAKMTVLAGVRKLSDAANGVVIESSTDAGANNGAFEISAPFFPGTNYSFRSGGTVRVISIATKAAPTTDVVSGVNDISGDNAILRINGAQAAINTADQGTGNYGNYPLYIGRRGGTSLPFNGRLYGLVIRGALSSTGEIQGSESYMNLHTGAY